MLHNKTLLVTGGTGSFSNAVLKKFLESNINKIRIFSQDEKKQNDMRIELNNEKLKFYIGNVRDYESINSAMNRVDYVFHAAALKQVPSCEFYPLEAIKTNVLGSENVLNANISNVVKKGNYFKHRQSYLSNKRYGDVKSSEGKKLWSQSHGQLLKKKLLGVINKEKLSNIIIKRRIPSNDFDGLVRQCDVGLVNLNRNFTIPNFPSKTLDYFEAGIHWSITRLDEKLVSTFAFSFPKSIAYFVIVKVAHDTA